MISKIKKEKTKNEVLPKVSLIKRVLGNSIVFDWYFSTTLINPFKKFEFSDMLRL